MKYLILLLTLAVLASGWVDEDGRDSSIPEGTLPPGGDAIELSILNTFQVSSAGEMFGLDTQEEISQLVVIDTNAHLIRAVEMGTGNPVWTIYTRCSYTFGCCHNWPSPYGWYINCYLHTNINYYDGSTWNVAFPNPAGSHGRGMDFQNDGNYIWETYSSSISHRIYRIDETGSSTSYAVPEIPSQMSGLTVFPYNGNLGIFVTCYDFQEWLLYEFDGSTMTYIGSGNPGLSNFTQSLGLTYYPDTDTFFWSYIVYGTIRWIAEIQFTESALEQSTWGSLKTQF